MRTLILIVALVILSQLRAFSQGCLPEGITFTTQEQIDNFQVNYPGCTEIEGFVIIEGEDITNLDSLFVLTTIEVGLVISNCPVASLAPLHNLTLLGGLNLFKTKLTSLEGLENAVSIEDQFDLLDNDSLLSLSGIDNLTSVGGNVWIFQNDGLQNLSGLNNLSSISGNFRIESNTNLSNLTGLENLGEITGSLTISSNNNLNNLNGLEGLTLIDEDIIIDNNPLLNDLNGLINLIETNGIQIHFNTTLTSIYGISNIQSNSLGDISIFNNSELSDCDMQSVCSFMLKPNPMIIIANNAPGCNSPEEVEEHCLTSIEKYPPNVDLILSPNPAASFITLTAPGDVPIEEAVIYNHLGQKVLTVKPVNNSVDVSGLKIGIYILEVTTTEFIGRQKLIKQ